MPDAETYNAFVESAELAGVDIVSVSGERRLPGEPPLVRFDLTAGYQVEGGTIRYRFDGVANLSDSEGQDYGEVRAAVVVSVNVEPDPDPACVQMFGAMTTTMTAHPYLREALATTAARIGFPGVLLPFLVRPGQQERET